MGAPVYATAGDLTAWLGMYPPVNSDTLLARASGDVDEALTAARYEVDGDELPTDAVVVDALRDAVCAQVAAWIPADMLAECGAGGRLGTVVVDPNRPPGLTRDARQALHRAGLLPSRARLFG